MLKIVVIPLVLLGLLIAYIQFEVPILVFWLNNTNDGLTASIAVGRLSSLQQKPKLVALLECPNSSARLFALRALATTQEAELWTFLPHLCNDPDREVRDAAIEYSGKLKVKASIPAIIKYFNDSALDKTTRGLAMNSRAIIALIEIAHPHKGALKILKQYSGDGRFRARMIESFVEMNHKRVVPIYKDLLLSGINEKAIGSVIKVLVKLDGENCGKNLQPMLKSIVPETRALVAKSLAKIKDKTALPLLEKALKDEKDKTVKSAIEKAIKKLS